MSSFFFLSFFLSHILYISSLFPSSFPLIIIFYQTLSSPLFSNLSPIQRHYHDTIYLPCPFLSIHLFLLCTGLKYSNCLSPSSFLIPFAKSSFPLHTLSPSLSPPSLSLSLPTFTPPFLPPLISPPTQSCMETISFHSLSFSRSHSPPFSLPAFTSPHSHSPPIISPLSLLHYTALCAGIINILPLISKAIPPSLVGLVVSSLVAITFKLPVSFIFSIVWSTERALSLLITSLLFSSLHLFLTMFSIMFSHFSCAFSLQFTFFYSFFSIHHHTTSYLSSSSYITFLKIKSLADVAGAATFSGGLAALPTFKGDTLLCR